MAETTANAVADYIIRFYHEHGDLITNLKLQKLVYYAQAWYLSLYEKPLFNEEFQAWISGPVQAELYARFKTYQWNPISEHNKTVLPEHIEEHLQEIIQVYGKYEAYYLERMTHAEEPWIKARAGIPPDQSSNALISKQDMQNFYQPTSDGEEKEANSDKTESQTEGKDCREAAIAILL